MGGGPVSGCLCISCREATAMARVVAEERRQDFEAWLAKRQDRFGRYPALPGDHETALLRETHWKSPIAIPAVTRVHSHEAGD
jgi:hypothetical protein